MSFSCPFVVLANATIDSAHTWSKKAKRQQKKNRLEKMNTNKKIKR